MGNIPIPFSGIPENIRARMIESRLFVCKMFSMSACIVGTAAYVRPVDPYYSTDYFGIFVPAFLTGYIIINSTEILAMYIDEPHIFLEVCFAVIGFFGNGLCGLYQFHVGIDWSAIFSTSIPTHLEQATDTRKLIVALTCFVNSIALLLVAIIRGIEKHLSRLSMSLEN